MIFEQTMTGTIQILDLDNMNKYAEILTPPSSNEDTPFYVTTGQCQPTYVQQRQSNVAAVQEAPYLKIVEQPVDRFRFRYKSEMTGTHGSLNGWFSDKTRKQTFPSVQLLNYDKPATIRCMIYQVSDKKDNNMPHAHRLVKRQGREEFDDPHDVVVSAENMHTHVFHNMGIIHTAKKNIVPELIRKKTFLKREEIARREGKFRPLNTKEEVEIKGLAEKESKSINLNIVCLRFDAFFELNGIKHPICKPIYTHGINNLKSALTGELKIVRMDHCSSPAKGGREIFLLVERVTKKNIKVRFFEKDDDDNILWEDYGKFSDLDVHHQYAIVLRTPSYKDPNIQSTVKVYIQLERPSDNSESDPLEFTYIPSELGYKQSLKRPRISYNSSYDSSNLPSNELPTTIHDLSVENFYINNSDLEVNSAELEKALKNIDSGEFLKIFNDYGDEYQSITQDVTVDNPLERVVQERHKGRSSDGFFAEAQGPSEMIIKRPIETDYSLAQRVYEELKNFLKSKPNIERTIQMLEYYFKENNKTNALHISIKKNDINKVMFILKLIAHTQQFDLVNVKNNDLETPLHLAVMTNNIEFVSNLLFCQANVSEYNGRLNTPLHIAILTDCKQEILSKLLTRQNCKEFIDKENNEGNTALNLAIDTNNLNALKMLMANGADINKRHNKNGFTPFRFAIEKQQIGLVKCLLDSADLDPMIYDFTGINPIQAISDKHNIDDIKEIIDDYVKRNELRTTDIEIKNEELSDIEETEEVVNVKLEPITKEELTEMYENVENFTPKCLEQISKMLDETCLWEVLAEHLDLGHLMRCNLWESNSSPSKLLLKLAVESTGGSVFIIRSILNDLHEYKIVEIIDNMVRSMNK